MKREYPVSKASIRARLLNISRERRMDFNYVLTRYACERLLYRLAQSKHVGRFALKGAMLFLAWSNYEYRPTRDLDLLGHGDDSDEALTEVFTDICNTQGGGDGLSFDSKTIRVTDIREDQEYQGKRVHLTGMLGKARIPMRIDIGFGDIVTPGLQMIEYPTLLGHPAPRLHAYPKETVVAEKFEAMVRLGMVNSRMKDFYDVWVISRVFTFDGRILSQAIKSTFELRRTQFSSDAPIALTEDFAENADNTKRWSAFIARNELDTGGDGLDQVIRDLNAFLMPIISGLSAGQLLVKAWSARGPWVDIR